MAGGYNWNSLQQTGTTLKGSLGGGMPSGFYSGGALPAGWYSGGALPVGFYGNPPYNFQGSPYGGAATASNVASAKSPSSATATPAGVIQTWDTIGKTITRGIGRARYPLQTIWAQTPIWPVEVEGPISPTITFAGAICAPIDPNELGTIIEMYMGHDIIYSTDMGGIVIPDGLSPEDAAALQWSLENAVIYPGTESQMPAPLILADKGPTVTNAFRGIRYIILQNYPMIETSGTGAGGGPPSIIWEPVREDDAVVEFLPGET